MERAVASVSDLEIRDLRLVVELSDRRSFTNAAESLHMSQSAFSRAVNDVERRVDTRLFTRTTRSVEPTSAGWEFVRLARALLARHESMIREFTLFQSGQRGMVTVATLPAFAAIVMPELLASIETWGIDVEVIDTSGRAAADLLLAGDADFAVTAEFQVTSELTFTPLIRDRFQVMFNKSHKFSGRTSVTWEQAVAEPMILPWSSSSVRILTDRLLGELGLWPRQLREAQSVGVVAGMVNAGLGITVLPAMVIPLTMFADLEVAELTNPTLDRTLGLLTMEGRPLTPAAQRFSSELISFLHRTHSQSPMMHVLQ